MGKTEHILKMDSEKPFHQSGSFHFCQCLLPNASFFGEKWASISKLVSTDINSINHNMEPRIHDCHISVLAIMSRRSSCSSLFLPTLALINISSSLLMGATFICLNYSRNLVTPSSTMSRVSLSQTPSKERP